MKQAERIAVNVGVTFLRMMTTIGLGLYATRLLVNALGDVDFGLFGAVVGGIAVMNVFQSALLVSSQRNLAFQIGKGDPQKLNAMFSACFVLFLATAIFLVSVGWLLKPIMLEYLQYPAERAKTVATLWGVMVLSLAVLCLRSPFHGLFMAHQAMVQDSIFMLLMSLMRLSVALLVSMHDGDRLFLYGCLFVGIAGIELVYMVIVALIRFPESHVRLNKVQWDDVKQLLSFGGWGLFDLIVLRMRQHGGNLILNPFFGPIVNAGYSVGNQLQIYPRRISMAISEATRPAIVQRHARGDQDFVRKMVLTASRMGTLFTAAIIMPFLLETNYVLQLWLVKVPPNAAEFCRYMFLAIFLEQLVAGFVSGVHAVGKIGRFTVISTVTLSIPFVLAVAAFAAGYAQPELLVQLLAVGICVAMVFQAKYVGDMIGVPFYQWLSQVVFRMLVAIGGSYLIASTIQANLGAASFQRCAVVTLSFLLSLAGLGWCFGFTHLERGKILGWGQKALPFVKRIFSK